MTMMISQQSFLRWKDWQMVRGIIFRCLLCVPNGFLFHPFQVSRLSLRLLSTNRQTGAARVKNLSFNSISRQVVPAGQNHSPCLSLSLAISLVNQKKICFNTIDRFLVPVLFCTLVVGNLFPPSFYLTFPPIFFINKKKFCREMKLWMMWIESFFRGIFFFRIFICIEVTWVAQSSLQQQWKFLSRSSFSFMNEK